MTEKRTQLTKLLSNIEKYAPDEGLNLTKIKNFGLYKSTVTIKRSATVNQPVILVLAQGKKTCFLEDKKYQITDGHVLVRFYPFVSEAEVNEATSEKPFLAAGLGIDLNRMADIVTRIDHIEESSTQPLTVKPSGIYTLPLNDTLLEPLNRLFNTLKNSRDIVMLSDSIIDEIYYRLLCDELGGALRQMLQQRGEILRISRVISHIHHNVAQPLTIAELANMIGMSKTAFHENFKKIMHLSPLQYVKSIKLFEARKLIEEGKKASEAGYLVGYNSPAQFSREYKRHFGFSPSDTLA